MRILIDKGYGFLKSTGEMVHYNVMFLELCESTNPKWVSLNDYALITRDFIQAAMTQDESSIVHVDLELA